MIGPVQEKLTRLNVKAIKKILRRPAVRSDLRSTAFVHREGSVSSKPPRKLAPKRTSSRKKKMLKKALVLIALSALAPKMRVTSKPKPT